MKRLNQQGVTLLEVLLVLVIGATFIVMGLRIYEQSRQQSDFNSVKSNVDILLAAMQKYYLANCMANRQYSDDTVYASSTGNLDPSIMAAPSGSSPQSKSINITTDLVTPGYLEKWPFNYSPLALSYVVQFNLYNDATQFTNNVHHVSFCNTANCTVDTIKTSNVYLWTVQVAVQVDPAQAVFYQGLMNADCVSSLSGSIVTPCSANPTPGGYLVFEHLPSYTSSKIESPLFISMPLVKAFKRAYTNDDDYAVTKDDAGYETNYENYLCGG